MATSLRKKPPLGSKFLDRRWRRGKTLVSDYRVGKKTSALRRRTSGVRYITSDPVGIWAGANTYGYPGQNALGIFDFTGLAGSSKIYKHGRGDYSYRRGSGSGSGCETPIWVGGYIVGWRPCDDDCPPTPEPDRPSPESPPVEKPGEPNSSPPAGPGTGAQPGSGATGKGGSRGSRGRTVDPFLQAECQNLISDCENNLENLGKTAAELACEVTAGRLKKLKIPTPPGLCGRVGEAGGQFMKGLCDSVREHCDNL